MSEWLNKAAFQPFHNWNSQTEHLVEVHSYQFKYKSEFSDSKIDSLEDQESLTGSHLITFDRKGVRLW